MLLLYIASIVATFLVTASVADRRGFKAGRNEGYLTGYNDGYDTGYYEGHEDGRA